MQLNRITSIQTLKKIEKEWHVSSQNIFLKIWFWPRASKFGFYSHLITQVVVKRIFIFNSEKHLRLSQ